MVLEVKVSQIETETCQSQTGFTLRVELPERARWAWMDYSVIFIISPDSPNERTKSCTLDGKKKIEYFIDGKVDFRYGFGFEWKVEVWKNSSANQDQSTTIIPMDRMEFDNLSDLTIKCGVKSIKVHKVQLAKSSEVFKSKFKKLILLLLYSLLLNCQHGLIKSHLQTFWKNTVLLVAMME